MSTWSCAWLVGASAASARLESSADGAELLAPGLAGAAGARDSCDDSRRRRDNSRRRRDESAEKAAKSAQKILRVSRRAEASAEQDQRGRAKQRAFRGRGGARRFDDHGPTSTSKSKKPNSLAWKRLNRLLKAIRKQFLTYTAASCISRSAAGALKKVSCLTLAHCAHYWPPRRR